MMKKHRWPALVSAAALIFSLGGCKKSDADKVQPVEGGHAVPVEAAAQLADLAAMLAPGDVDALSWTGPCTPTPEELAQLLARAAEHPAQPAKAAYYGLWAADFRFQPWDAQVHLTAGLQENVVCLTAEGFPDQALYLEDQDLYRILRTVHDVPRAVEEEVYARSRGLIEYYYNTLLEDLSQLDGGFDRWVVNTLTPAQEREDLQAQAYEMAAALYAPTPELAARQLAGGMYLDSQLRTFGLDAQYAFLVTIGGIPAGILPRTAEDDPAAILEGYDSVEALKESFWTAWGK